MEDQKVSLDGTLKIWNTKQEHSGTYICVASSNKVHKAFSTLRLTIRHDRCKYRFAIGPFFCVLHSFSSVLTLWFFFIRYDSFSIFYSKTAETEVRMNE